ncbi:MAG: PorT family protein [Chitinophagales bacterium]|nr:PorT family protein [Chitinophagales bacterium]MCB9021795.1 PorT family protein [Chitinophagales bacterium]MCB9030954.1 PorT family protein [Chitinophagales bacterium]HPE96342.1 outer membrane beta-barrel protein [Chitinophagales bacterium]HRX22519.1 outer membrane beta-barrel protein [Chitinophagales bacterium]
MRIVYWRKIICILLLLLPFMAKAQFHVKEYEDRFARRPYHFGIGLSYNSSYFKIRYDQSFINNDTLLTASALSGPGFNVSIVSNLRLTKHLDLRFIPGLAFAEKVIQYDQVQDAATSQRIESIYFNFPLSVKFKSDSYKDMKVYVLGGTTYSFDLASNAKARNAEDIVKIGTHDVSLDYGFGFEFYFPYFIFAPEIKICNGLNNVHVRDPLLIYSSSLDKLYARTILFTIHLEG